MRKNIRGSILIISHQERIFNIADEIVLIADGKVQKIGKKEDILPELLLSADKNLCSKFHEGGADCV